MSEPAEMGDRELLREFKSQQARSRSADDAFNALRPNDPARRAAYIEAQQINDRLRVFALEMRARTTARVAAMAANVDDELRDLLDGES